MLLSLGFFSLAHSTYLCGRRSLLIKSCLQLFDLTLIIQNKIFRATESTCEADLHLTNSAIRISFKRLDYHSISFISFLNLCRMDAIFLNFYCKTLKDFSREETEKQKNVFFLRTQHPRENLALHSCNITNMNRIIWQM